MGRYAGNFITVSVLGGILCLFEKINRKNRKHSA